MASTPSFMRHTETSRPKRSSRHERSYACSEGGTAMKGPAEGSMSHRTCIILPPDGRTDWAVARDIHLPTSATPIGMQPPQGPWAERRSSSVARRRAASAGRSRSTSRPRSAPRRGRSPPRVGAAGGAMAKRDQEALAARQWQAQRRSPERRHASRGRSPERRSRQHSRSRHDEHQFGPALAPSASEHSVQAGHASHGQVQHRQSSMTAAHAAAATQAAVEQAAALRAQATTSAWTAEPAPSNLDEACLKLDDVLGRVGAALRAVNDQYIESGSTDHQHEKAAEETAAPARLQVAHSDDAGDEEAATLAELAGLDSRLGEVQSRAVKAQEDQQRWRQFFMRADVAGRGTAHRDDLLALLSSSSLSITGTTNSDSVETLRQALAGCNETVTLQHFMAQVRVATAPDVLPRATHSNSNFERKVLPLSGNQSSMVTRAVATDVASATVQEPEQMPKPLPSQHASATQDIAPTVSAVSMISAPSDGNERYANRRVATTAPLAKLDLPSQEECDRLFERWDANGNGALSLAEIDAAVQDQWPDFNHKPSLMRAYHAADVNDDGFIKRREFHLLLEYLIYFTDLWDVFDAADTTHDHRLNFSEFHAAAEKLRIDATEEELEQAFITMDMRDDGQGFVLFKAFSKWCADRHIEAKRHGHGFANSAVSATPPSVGHARDRLHAALAEEQHTEPYDTEALRLAFAMYCESSSKVGKTKWMTSPKFMRMMRDSGVIWTRNQVNPEATAGSPQRGTARSLGPAGLPKAQIDVIFAKALRIGKQRDGDGPPRMANGKTLGFEGFVFALHSLAVQLFFPSADLDSLSQESIKSAHRRLVVAHILPATLGEPAIGHPAAAPGSPSHTRSFTHSQQQQLSPERYNVEVTLDPDDIKEKEVRALLSENRGNFSKIFEVYTRRSKQMTIEAWLAFCTDFDLTNALSKTVLSTVFRGAASSLSSDSESRQGHSHSMSVIDRSREAECLSMRQFLQALRHTALYLVTMESEDRGVGFFGRTTIGHRKQVQQLEADPVHAVKSLLGRLQRSQGVPKMKFQTGRTIEIRFKGAHSHAKATKQERKGSWDVDDRLAAHDWTLQS